MSTTKNHKQRGPAAPPSDAEDLLRKARKLRQCAAYLRKAEKLRQDVGNGLGCDLDGVLDRVATSIEAASATAKESSVPIAIGDVVRVMDEDGPCEDPLNLDLVTPTRVYLKDGMWRSYAYSAESGLEIGGRWGRIVPADLHRIQRDIVKALLPK